MISQRRSERENKGNKAKKKREGSKNWIHFKTIKLLKENKINGRIFNKN